MNRPTLTLVIEYFDKTYRLIEPNGGLYVCEVSDPNTVVVHIQKSGLRRELNDFLKTKGVPPMTQMSNDWRSFCQQRLEQTQVSLSQSAANTNHELSPLVSTGNRSAQIRLVKL